MPKRKAKPNLQRSRHDDLPATVGLVKEVRAELLAEMGSMRHEIGSVRHEIGSIRHEMGALEKRLDAKVDKVLGVVHGIKVIVEEQRGENRIVLDAIKMVMDRQDRIETHLAP